MPELSYQEKVLLVAYKILERGSQYRGYDFFAVGPILILTPWRKTDKEERLYSSSLIIDEDKVMGDDRTSISEIESKINEIFPNDKRDKNPDQ